MNEMLLEFVDSRGAAVRVDREAGVLRGVKILGLASRNGRHYPPDTLSKAAGLYEGAKVNVNHPKANGVAPRDYQDRIGVVRNVAARPGEGLFADFHFNPKHPLAEQLLWDAEHAPENVGFSHNVLARTARRGEQMVVEEILRVESVDLVADPATTQGLFEAAEPVWERLTAEDLQRHRPELVAAILAESTAELERLRGELARLQEAETVRTKQAQLVRLLREYHLPEPERADAWARAVVSPRFVAQALATADEAAMRALVEERAQLLRISGEAQRPASGPRSREQQRADHHGDLKSFLEAIT